MSGLNGLDFLILAVVFVGAFWVITSVIEDVLHRRRIAREAEERDNVFWLDDRMNDPCDNCGHARQAHYIRARHHTRGACQVEGCLCATYIPDRVEVTA